MIFKHRLFYWKVLFFFATGLFSSLSFAADYHCIQIPSRQGNQFLCKLTVISDRHIQNVVGARELRNMRLSMDRLTRIIGLPPNTPMAACANGNGIANASLGTQINSLSASRFNSRASQINRDISVKGGGMFEVGGSSADRMASRCSGAGGSAGGAGSNIDSLLGDRNRGDLISLLGGNRLDLSGQDQLIENTRNALLPLMNCNNQITNPRLGGIGAIASGGEASPGLLFSILETLATTAGELLGNSIFGNHFLGADYSRDGTTVGVGITRYKSLGDPENSYLDVYEAGNQAGVPADTKTATNNKSARGGTISVTVFPSGSMTSIEKIGNTTIETRSNNAFSSVTTTYDPDPNPPMPGTDEVPTLVKRTVLYNSSINDPDKKIVKVTDEYNDGSKVVQEFDEDGKPKGEPKVTPPQNTGMPNPDNPKAGTCEGRAQWVSDFIRFCDNQGWRAPNCRAALIYVNNCADPLVLTPTPNGPEMICTEKRKPINSYERMCEQRKMFELAVPGSPSDNCKIPNFANAVLQRDRGFTDPSPISNTRNDRNRPTTGTRCRPNEVNCR